jgi:hypothetical protein
MRWLPAVVMLAGCGFEAGGQSPGGDAVVAVDAPGDGATPADGADPTDAPIVEDAPDIDAATGCAADPDYTQLGASGYLTLSSAGWADGEAACEARGAHLVVLDDNGETTTLIALLSTGNTWLGVTSLANDDAYHPVTDQTTFIAPASYSANRCVRRKSDASIEARSNCGETNAVICECDGRPVVRANFAP